MDEGDEVIIPAPYWLTYPEVVKTCGGVPVFVEGSKENGFKITPEQLEAAITPKTKLLIFNSPCNPTGAVYSEAEVRALAAVCEKHGIFVLSDEIYEKLVYGETKPFSMAAVSDKMKELTITVNGVSKTYAMTGWRIGYLAAPKDIAKAIDSFQSHATSNACSVVAVRDHRGAHFARGRGRGDGRALCPAAASPCVERIAEMKGAYCIVPEGAFYIMLVVSGVYGKKCGEPRHHRLRALRGRPARRRKGRGRARRALRRGRLRAALLLALDGGHARGARAHRRVPEAVLNNFFRGNFTNPLEKYTKTW